MPEFNARVVVEGVELGTGHGRTKKEAEQQAAREAHDRLLDGTNGARSRGEAS
jgi:ribonuclease-3